MLTALLLASPPMAGAAHAQADDPGLRAATRRFPQLVLGPSTRPAKGTGPFARSCPAPGGRVEQRGGPTVSYDGADPANPDLCLMRLGGRPAKAWYGIWLTAWPGAEQAQGVLDRLIRGRTGDTEGFVVRMAANRTYYDILRNEGLEDIWLVDRVLMLVAKSAADQTAI